MDVTPDATDAAWAAGFLDGEGWFGLDPRGTPTIEAAQVASREPLDRLLAMFGGTVRQRRDGAFVWRLCGAPGARAAILQLHRFLTVKRQRAERLLACAIWIRPRGAQRLDPVERQMRAALKTQLLEA